MNEDEAAFTGTANFPLAEKVKSTGFKTRIPLKE